MNKHIKILIVEDEQIVALDLKRRLTRLGYHVVGMAANADKAISLVNRELPNIVLMDIHIQGSVDGVETAARMQKIHSVPIIYLTAYSEEKTFARAKTTKPYGYLLKPFSDRELHIIIQVSIERYESDILLKKNEQHFRLALEAAHLGTWEVTKDSSEIFLRKSPDGSLQQISKWNSFFHSIIEEDQPKVINFINNLRGKNGIVAETEFRVNSGTDINSWYKLYGKSFDHNIGNYQIVGVLQETTDSQRARNKLAQAATVFECASEGIIILNKDKRFNFANNAFYKITEFQQEELENKELPFLTSNFQGETIYKNIWHSCSMYGHWQGELPAIKKNKEKMYIWMSIGVIPAETDSEEKFVVMISDITVIRKTEAQLSHIAYYDSLTNLPNRMLIMDRLKQALANTVRENSVMGVLFIDLDNFKRINDTLGHSNGDKLLCLVSKRMQLVLRQSDTLGRLGGDEFIIIITNAESYEALETVAEKVLENLSMPIIIDNTEIVPSCSIGISASPNHSIHPDELVQMADTAMYEAKNRGKNNYAFYHPSLTQKAAHHLTREQELYHALAKNQFFLCYQPQLSPTKSEITGVEALIRWHHPTKGLLSPSEIIPIAESSRLIIEIGYWILTEACRQLNVWRKEGLIELRIAVNISIRQLADKQLGEFIAKLLHKFSLPAHLLELEITESCLQNELIYITCLEQLAAQGIQISIDDFGTGYSCLSSLKNLPIDRLKIDQSFVKGIPQDTNDCAIAAAILALAQKLNLAVIAEGIETQAQSDYLTNLGCNELQGYLLSHPVRPEQIPDLFNKIPLILPSMKQ